MVFEIELCTFSVLADVVKESKDFVIIHHVNFDELFNEYDVYEICVLSKIDEVIFKRIKYRANRINCSFRQGQSNGFHGHAKRVQ